MSASLCNDLLKSLRIDLGPVCVRTLINAILGCDVLCRVSRYIYLPTIIHVCMLSEFTSVSMLSTIVARPRRADYVLMY